MSKEIATLAVSDEELKVLLAHHASKLGDEVTLFDGARTCLIVAQRILHLAQLRAAAAQADAA